MLIHNHVFLLMFSVRNHVGRLVVLASYNIAFHGAAPFCTKFHDFISFFMLGRILYRFSRDGTVFHGQSAPEPIFRPRHRFS